MSEPPRRTLIVAVLSASVAVMGAATFETTGVAIRNEFDVTTQMLAVTSAVPAACSALMVFVAGMLSKKFTWFVLVRWAAAMSSLTLLVGAAAPSLAVLTVARAIGGMSVVVLMVSGVGILQQGYRDEQSRARVFGILAAVPPVIMLTVPVVAGTLTDWISWRVALLAFALTLVALIGMTIGLPPLVPPDEPVGSESRQRLEWWTPLMAGLALAALIGALISLPVSSLAGGILAGLSTFALALTVLLWRRSRNPGLDVSVLRQPAMAWIVAATLLTTVVNFSFFAAIWLQSQPGATTLTTAMALTIPQIAGITGGIAGGRLSARFGPYPVAVTALVVGSVGGFAYLVMDANSPAILVIAAVTVTQAATLAAAGPLTQIFLEQVQPGREGAAAAWRTAIRTLGTAVGGVLVISVATLIYRGSIATALEDRKVPAEVAAAVAADLQKRVALSAITSRYQLPDQVVTDLASENPALRQAARADAMGTAGAFTVGANLLATGALLVAARRRKVRLR